MPKTPKGRRLLIHSNDTFSSPRGRFGVDFDSSRFCNFLALPFAINPCIFREILMSQRSSRDDSIATDPGATAGTPPDDQLPADGKDLGDEVLTSSEVSVSPGYDNTLDISVNLQSLVELPPDFC